MIKRLVSRKVRDVLNGNTKRYCLVWREGTSWEILISKEPADIKQTFDKNNKRGILYQAYTGKSEGLQKYTQKDAEGFISRNCPNDGILYPHRIDGLLKIYNISLEILSGWQYKVKLLGLAKSPVHIDRVESKVQLCGMGIYNIIDGTICSI